MKINQEWTERKRKQMKVAKRIISYMLMLILILNLFSDGSGYVYAQVVNDDVEVYLEVVKQEVEGITTKKLKLSYQVNHYSEGETISIERTMTKQGSTDVILEGTFQYGGNFTTEMVDLTEEGTYIVKYRLKDSGATMKTVEILVENTAPVLDVTLGEGENPEINIIVTEENLDKEKALCLSYTREFYEDFTRTKMTGSCNILLEDLLPEGGSAGDRYMANFNLQSFLSENVGEGIYSDLKLTVTDKSLNVGETTISQKIVVDTKKPEYRLVIGKQDGAAVQPVETLNEVEYYNCDCQRLEIVVGDLQLDNCNITLKRGNATVEPISITVNDCVGESDFGLKTYIYSLEMDGSYTLELSAKDKGNNQSNLEKCWVKDSTSPIIRIVEPHIYGVDGSCPVPRVENNKKIYYFNTNVTYEFQVQEANYSTTRVTIKNADNNEDRIQLTDEMQQEEQTFRHSFGEEGCYGVYAWAKDLSGNEASGTPSYFVIDKTAPELFIQGVSEGFRTTEDVTVTFKAKEINPEYASYKITIKKTDLYGEDRSENIYYNGSDGGWTKEDAKTDKKSIVIGDEGNYEVTFEGKDKAGNSTKVTRRFMIDKTPPEISRITYSDVDGMLLLKYNTIYSNQVIALEFDVKDRVSGVDAQGVCITIGMALDRTGDTPVYIAHRMLGNRYVVYLPSDVGVSEFSSPVTIWARDGMGNESYLTSNKVIYTTDYSDIEMHCDTDYTIWTNEDVTFHTRVEDEKAGIDTIVYKVNNRVVRTMKFSSLTTSYEWDVTATESATQVTGYAVEVEVTNNCGTVNTMRRQVYIDKVKPAVELSGVTNGQHYREDCRIQADISDVSYKDTSTRYVIRRTMEGITDMESSGVYHSQDYDSIYAITLLKEGTYEVYAISTDGAGNQTISNTLRFTIDKTAPRIGMTGIAQKTVSSRPVVVDFSCEEVFFEGNQVTIQVECTLDGQTKKYTIDNFPSIRKYATMQHTFSEDGTYTVTMMAVDEAGNVAIRQVLTFTIDQTKPVIRVEGTDNYQMWGQSAGITFVVEESYYSTNVVTITGVRRNLDGTTKELSIPQFVCTGKLSQLYQSFNEDGIYDLFILSKDEAGNTEQMELHFIVDKTAPVIRYVDTYDGGYYQEFQLAKNLNTIFQDLTVISHKILLNGIEYNGTDIIKEEGKYNLYVEATDEIGHRTTKVAEFIIDHTAPKVIFSGVTDGDVLYEKGQVELSLTNVEDEIIGVRLNGKELGSDTRRIEYMEYGSYKIDVDCRDLAGNEVTRSVYFVYANPVTTMMVFGAAGMVVGLGLFILILKKRKGRIGRE